MKRVLMPLLIAAVMMSSGCKQEKNNTVVTVDNMPILEKQVDEIVEKSRSLFAGLFKKDYAMAVLEYPNGVSFVKTSGAELGGGSRRQALLC